MAKYNQLLRIEEELGASAVYGYKRGFDTVWSVMQGIV
jgi:enolase